MRIPSDQNRLFVLAYIVLSTISMFLYAIFNTIPVWDMLGYAATVHSLDGVNPTDIHSVVYSDMKLHTTKGIFHELTMGSSYRQVMFNDTEAFIQQIPFYKMRVVFILLISALNELGLNIFFAMHFLSAFFGAAGFFLAFLGFRNLVHWIFWVLAPLIFFGITLDLSFLQHGGIDAFAFFWLALAIVLYIRQSKFLLPILALCVLIRTDFILFTLMMMSILWLTEKADRKNIIIWCCVAVLSYVLVNLWAGNLGWFALIHFVFVSDMQATHPAEYSLNRTFDLADYLGFLFSYSGWTSKWVWLSFASAGFCLGIHAWLALRSNSEKHLASYDQRKSLLFICVVSCAYVVLHYVLFPALFMRYFIGPYLFMCLCLFATLTQLFAKNLRKAKEAESLVY